MRYLILILLILTGLSCKKYLEIDQPRNLLASSAVFETDATATAAQAAIYSQMESGGLFYFLSAYTGLSSDEFRNHSSLSDNLDLANNTLTADNGMILSLWTNLYKYIYQSNAILKGIAGSTGISATVSQQLEGEARFVRALCHYYLTTLFGPVPVVMETDYSINSVVGRSGEIDVYAFILDDLVKAKELMAADYRSGSNGISLERVRPNKWSAAALIARVHLHLRNWQQAEQAASEVIKQSYYFLPGDLNQVFLRSSSEAIFQIMSVVPKFNSFAGANYILASAPSSLSVAPHFLQSFRPNDKRLSNWVKSISTSIDIFFYPFKYKVPQNASTITEYTVVLRLAEQYLIRAEAKAMQQQWQESEQDLNIVRERAGLPKLAGISGTALLDSIQVERKFELMFESGDRWINLRRYGNIDEVLGQLKAPNWSANDQLYPVPAEERLRNSNLTQNAGY